MSETHLICNFKKCKTILTETAYITRCSHAFCEVDAIREIESQTAEKKCPACQSPLVEGYDLVKVVLNPSEEFKSMVLAGIRPEFVMDIATRAVMFWIYQLQQKNYNQKMISKAFRDSIAQMKINFDFECGILKTKIQDCEKKIDELEKELEIQKRKCVQLSVKLSEKSNEVQRWQMAYESVRKEQLSDVILQRNNNPDENREIKPGNMGPQTMEQLLAPHKLNREVVGQLQNLRGCGIRREHCNPIKCGERRGFCFQPQLNPNHGSPKPLFERDALNRKAHPREFTH